MLYEALRKRTDCEEFQTDLRDQSIEAIKCQMKFKTDKYKMITWGETVLV